MKTFRSNANNTMDPQATIIGKKKQYSSNLAVIPR